MKLRKKNRARWICSMAKFSKIWTRIIYPYSHKIIAVSDGIYKYLIYDLKQKPTKIIKVPNPINVKEINVKSKKNVSLICLIII